MQIPKWAWCCIGGLVGVLPMMGATLLSGEQIQCVEHNSPNDVTQSVSPECDRVHHSPETPDS